MAKGSIEWKHTVEDGLVIRMKPGFAAPGTGDVRRHAGAAHREMLLTLQSLVDSAIGCSGGKGPDKGQPPTRIDVE